MDGMYCTAGWDSLRSQFVMVREQTPICSATCLWRRPRSNRRARIWSPSVFNWLG